LEGSSIGGVLVSSVVEGDGCLNQATVCWGFVVSRMASGELFGVEGFVLVDGWGWEGFFFGMGWFSEVVVALSMSMGANCDANNSPMSSWASRRARSLACAILTGPLVIR
jgi:hypothetical protein